jgi:hypothetical protein
MQCSSGFDLWLASYEEVKLGLSDQTCLVENGRQNMSNQLGLLSNFSRVFKGSLGAILLIGPFGFEVWKNVNMLDL